MGLRHLHRHASVRPGRPVRFHERPPEGHPTTSPTTASAAPTAATDSRAGRRGGGPEPLPPGANQPPEFAEGSRTIRSVEENREAGGDYRRMLHRAAPLLSRPARDPGPDGHVPAPRPGGWWLAWLVTRSLPVEASLAGIQKEDPMKNLRVPMIILAALHLAFTAFTAMVGMFADGGTIVSGSS